MDCWVILQWDNVDDKTTFGIYAGGALLTLWIASSVVGAFNSIPLVSCQILMSQSYSCYNSLGALVLHLMLMQRGLAKRPFKMDGHTLTALENQPQSPCHVK